MSTARNVSFLVLPVNEEEEDLTADLAGTSWEDHLWVHDNLIVALTFVLEFLTSNFNCRAFGRADGSDQDLIFGRDHLVQCELNLAHKIMILPILKIVEVINVVHCHSEQLPLFEFVGDVEALDPLWIEIVHYDLSHSDH